MPFFSGYHNEPSPPSYAEYKGRTHAEWILWGLLALGLFILGWVTMGLRWFRLIVQTIWTTMTHFLVFWLHPQAHIHQALQKIGAPVPHSVNVGPLNYAGQPTRVPAPPILWSPQTPFSLWWIVGILAVLIGLGMILAWHWGRKGARHALSRS
jgi:hypothetical protein